MMVFECDDTLGAMAFELLTKVQAPCWDGLLGHKEDTARSNALSLHVHDNQILQEPIYINAADTCQNSRAFD